MILLCLLLTLFLESAVLLTLGERAPLVYLFLAVTNLLTNLTANLVLIAVSPVGNAYLLFVIATEVLIAVSEGMLIGLFTRSRRKGLLYGVCCNAVSYTVGTLILHFIF